MRIAYLVNQYPKVSHSFIRREIAALEALGASVDRLALRTCDSELTDPEDIAEANQTIGILSKGVVRILLSVMLQALQSPKRLAEILVLALRVGKRSERGQLIHMVYLSEACVVAEHCREFDVQHIHAHFGTNSATVAMLASRLAGIPWSFTVHGPEEFDLPRSIALDEKIARAAFTVAISSYGRSQLYRWAHLEDWHKIQVVHCGLDLENFDRTLSACPPAHPHLVCVGRLCEQKGQLLLIDATAQVVKDVPDFKLTLVGDGEMRDTVERRIDELGLRRNVEITGWADSHEVRKRISEARALVLGSFAEGLPVVIMESLAMGRPAISTAIAGIPELLDDSCGWLITAGDVDSLAVAMREAITADADQLTRMGQEGRRRVEAQHDQKTEAKKLLNLIERVTVSVEYET